MAEAYQANPFLSGVPPKTHGSGTRLTAVWVVGIVARAEDPGRGYLCAQTSAQIEVAPMRDDDVEGASQEFELAPG